MRQFHAYIVARKAVPGGSRDVRLLLAVAVATCGLAIAPSAGWPARAVPGDCPPVADDARTYAVAARSVVLHQVGQWNLLVQVVHWRGDTATGGPTALTTLETARSRLRGGQSTDAQAS